MANSNEDTPNTPTHNPDVRPTYIYYPISAKTSIKVEQINVSTNNFC